MLELLLITNSPEEAGVWDSAGVDIIFVDLEIKGKVQRQGHLDTVISKHKASDISAIKPVLSKSKLLVRVNPLNDSSQSEVDDVIARGADIIMLPMFNSADEVSCFADMVNGRCQIYPLIETPAALNDIESLAKLDCVSGYHFGLNDLHLALQYKFMFEIMLLPDFIKATEMLKKHDKFFGIGGVGRMGSGVLPAEMIVRENYRLGSNRIILSRSFKNEVTKDRAALEVAALKEVYSHSINADLALNLIQFQSKLKEVAGDLS